ncbi:hypothetical protein DYH55_03895 [Methylovirgula sp. 4M-Z18]|nr:hypothetical protein DYH55_03895 [Methylovirgula sp. 4M-Z18]
MSIVAALVLCAAHVRAQSAAPSQTPQPSPQPAPPSHARVHQCAVEWQEKKKTGAAAGNTWREFAAECYARK